MKFAVFALISMYVIVQTCGKIIINHPTTAAYYSTVVNGRKFLVPQSSSLASTSAHFYNNKNGFKQQNYMHAITSDGRRMIVPVPVVQFPVAGISASYNAATHSASSGSSASSAAHNKQHSFNYQQSLLTARRNNDIVAVEEPAEEIEEIPTVPTCENKVVDVSSEEPEEVEVKITNNSEKYRKEICLYIAPKITSLLVGMTPEEAESFMNDFVVVVDNYCDFATLEE